MANDATHVYVNSVKEWYVAPTLERAIELARTYLRDVVGVSEEEMDLDLEQEPDNKILRITEDGPYEMRELTCAQWARENGEGFLASTEF